MGETDTRPHAKAKPKVERPKLYKVILHNDDYTPWEFVVMVLKSVFHMTEDQAYRVMIAAHKLGACVVAVYTREIAESKANEGADARRSAGFPLSFTTEKED